MSELFKDTATVLGGIGGLYKVRTENNGGPLSGKTFLCRARGNLRRDGLLVGDRVEIEYSELSFTESDGLVIHADDRAGVTDCAISSVCKRKNELIRPAMANLDFLFVICACSKPYPDLPTIDKLLSVAEYYEIDAAVIVTKADLDKDNSDRVSEIYKKAGYPVFTPGLNEEKDRIIGIEDLRAFIETALPGKTAAFCGASGVGKSTLMGSLFPDLNLETGDISRKTGRGKHTTRKIDLFPVELKSGETLIADTPGFSLVDFENFDFLPFEALPETMRDFLPYFGKCRYPDCSHTLEKECAVNEAVRNGEISESRHESYLEMYSVLKKKPKWQ